MTAQDIRDRLFSDKGVSPERILKARGLALRSKVDWADVLASLTPEQRAMVEAN